MADTVPHTLLELRFHPWETCFPSSVEAPEGTQGTPLCYVASGHMLFRTGTYLARCYQFYYTKNNAIGCGWCISPEAEALGYHDHDVERITILYETSGAKRPQWVYFGAHSRGQGMWLPWEACEKTPDGALVAYVSRGSHAFYPYSRLYWRIFGFANDACSRYGKSIRIREYVHATGWTSSNQIQVLAKVPPLPQASVTAWQRFCLPWYVHWLKYEMK